MNKVNITPWNHSLKMISTYLLYVFGKDQITIINIDKYIIVNKINTLNSDFLSCFTIINDRLITGDWNGNLKEWKINRSNVILKNTMEKAHFTGIMSIDVLHDGKLISASQDKTIKIWS
jgi:WD40 repeat protein